MPQGEARRHQVVGYRSCSCLSPIVWASQAAQVLKNPPANAGAVGFNPTQQAWARSLGWGDPLEEEVATHSSILAWEIPWTEEPGGLQSMGPQRVRPY